ncbi:MAG TPA: nucleotidyltransferase domain-containing protein [Phycisphaerae bacterium]|nr:nucleotidyltransferase domain-containing protein [Phycisphaerae bacterium]
MRVMPLSIDEARLQAFCREYGVAELSLFGSILRDDFSPSSDVDVLITLRPGRTMTLEADMEMREKLSAMFGGRPVDMLRREYLKNPYRKAEILRTREVLYAE